MPEAAPIIFFDGIQTFGVGQAIGHLALTAQIIAADPGSDATRTERVTVVHLRFPIAMLPKLRGALDRIELAAAAPPASQRN